LFKAGVQPMWEDPMNEKGGKWVAGLSRGKREEFLDSYWIATV
jgi:translation initiation factor 4E